MNRLHRRYCSSDAWAARVRDAMVPWVLRNIDLGTDVLEIGPGPGLTTRVLSPMTERLTAVEIDERLAARLRVDGVRVLRGDGAALPFADASFTGAVCFTMLHHVPTADLQDALLRETRRVLRPGGVFAGSDSMSSLKFRLAHLWDTMVIVDPDTFAERLAAAGFSDPVVRRGEGAFRFRANA